VKDWDFLLTKDRASRTRTLRLGFGGKRDVKVMKPPIYNQNKMKTQIITTLAIILALPLVFAMYGGENQTIQLG